MKACLSLACVVSLLPAGCASMARSSPRQPSPEEARGLADARAALIAAATSSNAAALAGIYTADAVLMNPNQPDVRGRTEIESFFRAAFGAIAIREMALTPFDVTMADGRAYELSEFAQLVERAGSPRAEDRGRVMLVWALENDGKWRVRYALVNSSLARSPLH